LNGPNARFGVHPDQFVSNIETAQVYTNTTHENPRYDNPTHTIVIDDPNTRTEPDATSSSSWPGFNLYATLTSLPSFNLWNDTSTTIDNNSSHSKDIHSIEQQQQQQQHSSIDINTSTNDNSFFNFFNIFQFHDQQTITKSNVVASSGSRSIEEEKTNVMNYFDGLTTSVSYLGDVVQSSVVVVQGETQALVDLSVDTAVTYIATPMNEVVNYANQILTIQQQQQQPEVEVVEGASTSSLSKDSDMVIHL